LARKSKLARWAETVDELLAVSERMLIRFLLFAIFLVGLAKILQSLQ